MRELIEQVVKALVDTPEAVVVRLLSTPEAQVVEVTVAEEDLRDLLGPNGETLQALRRLVGALSRKQGSGRWDLAITAERTHSSLEPQIDHK